MTVKLLLIHPPPWSPDSIPGGISMLSSYLDSTGHDGDFEVRDYNINFYNHLLSDEFVRDFQETSLAGRVTTNQSEINRMIGGLKFVHNTLRTSLAYDQRKIRLVNQRTARYFKWLSSLISPGIILLNNIGLEDNNRYRELHDYLSNSNKATVIRRLLLKMMSEDIAELNPNIIGFSIEMPAQFSVALFYCRWIKRHYSNVLTLIGGGLVSILDRRILGDLRYHADVDAYVRGRGESVLGQLLSMSKPITGDDLQKVNNLIIRDKKKIYVTTLKPPIPNHLLPHIKFDRLDLSAYLIERPVLPYAFNVRCYWNRCRFCSYQDAPRELYQPRNGKQVWENILSNYEAHGAEDFVFLDHALSTTSIKQFAKYNKGRFRGWGYMRLDHAACNAKFMGALKESGLDLLYIGLESGSQSNLERMRKGINLSDARIFFKLAHELGIYLIVFVIQNYPGETIEEAEETIDYLYSIHDYVDEFLFPEFVPVISSPVYYESFSALMDVEDKYLSLSSSYFPSYFARPANPQYDRIAEIYNKYSSSDVQQEKTTKQPNYVGLNHMHLIIRHGYNKDPSPNDDSLKTGDYDNNN